ncbi:hypothetical protein REMIM1_PF00119 (plasmid) [Rhizobium etli bv. mimosae str. Mim1]|nr:hypothetical protein REMIM1_PF00119 [Rhizobium etli bv. mimosae str. Mim1]
MQGRNVGNFQDLSPSPGELKLFGIEVAPASQEIAMLVTWPQTEYQDKLKSMDMLGTASIRRDIFN